MRQAGSPGAASFLRSTHAAPAQPYTPPAQPGSRHDCTPAREVQHPTVLGGGLAAQRHHVCRSRGGAGSSCGVGQEGSVEGSVVWRAGRHGWTSAAGSGPGGEGSRLQAPATPPAAQPGPHRAPWPPVLRSRSPPGRFVSWPPRCGTQTCTEEVVQARAVVASGVGMLARQRWNSGVTGPTPPAPEPPLPPRTAACACGA